MGQPRQRDLQRSRAACTTPTTRSAATAAAPSTTTYNGDGPYGIAVHTNGTGDGVTNSGTRIAQPVFNNYLAWAAAA